MSPIATTAVEPNLYESYTRFPAPVRSCQYGLGFDVHVYFHPHQAALAHALHADIASLFPELPLTGIVDPADFPPTSGVAAHPLPNFKVDVATPREYGAFVPWITFARKGMSVLVHPQTDDLVSDHDESAVWIGEKLGVKLETFKRLMEADRA
ncbi:hypothetical protein HK101_000481 [Irineochytrium annulatum]|nr:hypothetical protein HK101_000481 [Irineochytrium annulatum]